MWAKTKTGHCFLPHFVLHVACSLCYTVYHVVSLLYSMSRGLSVILCVASSLCWTTVDRLQQWWEDKTHKGKDWSLFPAAFHTLCCVVSVFHRYHWMYWHLRLLRHLVSFFFYGCTVNFTTQLQFDGSISKVQPPGECFSSSAGDGFVDISAMSNGRTSMLTSAFDFQHVVSY